MSNNRRRSMSVSTVPYSSQSDTTASISSSLWNSNKSTKSNFLSRFKSPNATPPTIVTPSKSTSTNIPASLPPIHGQQKIKRKPIVSQQTSGLSASLSPTTTSSGTTTATSRKKYEALLGIRTEDLISENLNSKKKSNGNNVTQTAKGFGNIFKKKRSKSLDKKVNGENISALFYNTHKQQPQEAIDPSAYGSNKINVSLQQGNYVLPPISQKQHHVERQENALNTLNNTKIIYTSPIKTPIVNQSMGDKPVILANNHVYKPQYHQYEVGEQPSAYSRSKAVNDQLSTPNPPMNDAARWSTASTQKSTGSCSIYSTFESESIYGANDSSDNVNNTANTSVQLEQGDESSKPESINADYSQATDLVSIVASNVQTRNPARLVVEKPAVHEDIEDENDSSYEDDDDLHDKDSDYSINRQSDVFVDATDISLEELEREKIEARLSKRLSGGHFGSAGGLMISILASSSTETKAQRRTSRPPPEDVVQSMMNWKRHSGHGTTKYVMPDQQPPQQHANEQQSNKSTVIDDKDISPSPLPPTVPEKYTQPVMPQRPLPPNPNILLTTTQEAENEGDDDEEKEKSIPIESIEPAEHSDDPKQCASRLWDEDESFVQRERIAEWLGQSKELNANTLYEYLNYFDFATMRLDSAFRKVCSKLYFRAEAQQIDRILEAFAKRYWQCNPKTIFGSADIVYAVVYSLLLLNTDLHVAQGNYTRMTRQAFVKNTMSTINDQQKTDPKWAAKKPNFMLAWEAHIEAYLKDMYISVKNYQILQPMQNNMDDDGFNVIEDNSFLSVSTSTSNKRMSIMGGKRMIDIKRSLNTMIHKSSSTRESMLFLDEPSPRKSSSSNTRQQQYPTSPHSSKSIHSTSRRNSFSSSHSTSGTLSPKPTISSNASQLSPNQSHMMNFMDTHAADLFANRPPYLKEGVVMRKHLLESANQKAKHREWRECLLVVGQGELKMYGLQSENASDSNSISSGRRNVLRASSASFANLADTLSKNYQNVTNNGGTSNSNVSLSYGDVAQNNSQRWATYSQLIGSVELNHSLSNALPPPGYNKSRPHVFAIQEPNGGVYLIQATSNEQVVEWVSTCNYWAARQSKEPLQGGVGNLEYGWGSCLDDVILDLDAVESGEKITGKYIHDPDAINLSHWIPPAPTMVSSILDEKAQFESLQTYVNQLNEEINEHREIKQKIIVKFQQKGQNHSRAFANWESKSKYMLHEIIKYQNYCDSLEKSIQSREIEEEDAAARESNPVIN